VTAAKPRRTLERVARGTVPKPWKGDKWKQPFLLNWPPSRGPMPPWMRRERPMRIPEPLRAEVERPARRARGAEAQLRRPPTRRQMRDLRGTPGTWWTGIHVATLGGITAAQAERLVHVSDDPGRAGYRRVRRGGKRQEFPANAAIRVRLSYPLSRDLVLTVRPYTIPGGRRPMFVRSRARSGRRVEMTVGYFLWAVAREYRRIYRRHRHWGVWGHGLDDLWFEIVEVTGLGKDGVWEADIGIGS
jgi:hypothetical protein